MEYRPSPVDTSEIRLPEGVLDLIEILARNNHEQWAAGRMREGWRYGSARDDVRKEHPYLVPYDSLPESEREYDRRCVLATLQLLYVLGYRIATKDPGVDAGDIP